MNKDKKIFILSKCKSSLQKIKINNTTVLSSKHLRLIRRIIEYYKIETTVPLIVAVVVSIRCLFLILNNADMYLLR